MQVRQLTVADGEAIATWRYPGRFATYDVREVVSSQDGYWAVVNETDLVGYCCFGPEARVPGVEHEEGALDVGYGMRPDLVGHGLGRSFVAAILDHAEQEFHPQRFRLLILRWNERSRRVAEALGFERGGVVRNADGEFLVMTRPAISG